ncbi:MAG: histidine--tRNA ligase [Bdellovibrionota bacterium]
MTIQNIKGMPDILPSETPRWRFMEEKIRGLMDLYSYNEIRTPILEETALFVRSVGEHTDIVGKEMFTFTDQGDVQMSLRPEGTAPVMRSYIQNHFHQQSNFHKLYYMGPMFRRERPQKGRLRQFHQLGVEAIGLAEPLVDVEVISLLMDVCKSFSLPNISLEINSIGDTESRKKYRDVIQEYFKNHSSKLSDGEKERLENNPMRLLDSKNPALASAIAEAPSILEYLNTASKKYFDEVQNGLEAIGIPFHVNPRIVRGIDYYCHTAFEVMVSGLGSQNTVGAGGRYDKLATDLGGKETPAIGFAMGLERLLLSIEDQRMIDSEKTRIEIVPLEDSAKSSAFQIAQVIRATLPTCVVDVEFESRSLKAALRNANKTGAKWICILGEAEMSKGEILVKNLATGDQKNIPSSSIATYLKDNAGK